MRVLEFFFYFYLSILSPNPSPSPQSDSLKALLRGPKELPPGRNDLEIVNDDIFESLLYYCKETYEQKILEHPGFVGLLEKDQALAIIAYACEYPYKVYFWLNAWLMQDRRLATINYVIIKMHLSCLILKK